MSPTSWALRPHIGAPCPSEALVMSILTGQARITGWTRPSMMGITPLVSQLVREF